jgi:hypothetical protein
VVVFVGPQLPGGKAFSAQAFGAKGDGSVDDTAALNAAVVAASNYGTSNNGATLIIEPGKYKLNGKVRIKPNVTYVCHGAYFFNGGVYDSSAYLLWDIDSANGYTGTSNVTVLGGIWDALGQNAPIQNGGTPATGKGCMHFGAGRNYKFYGCTFRNVASFHAMDIKGVDGLIIDGCRFEGYVDNNNPAARNMSEAIQLEQGFDNTTPCKNVKITNCYMGPAVDGSGLGGFGKLVGSHNDPTGVYYENIVITNNTIESPKENGIGFYSLRNSVIANNVINNAGRDGIRLTAGNDGTTSTNFNNVIANNIIGNSAYAGISLESANDNVISGNFVYNSGNAGISCSAPYTAWPTLSTVNTGPSSRNIISNNTVVAASRTTNNAKGAINITGAFNIGNRIVGNTFKKNGSGNEALTPIRIEGANASGTYISGNVFGPDWSTDYLSNITTSNADFRDNAKPRTSILADFVMTNTTTMANVTGASFYADANSTYKIEAYLAVSVSANNPDVKTTWTFPSGTTGAKKSMGPAANDFVAETPGFRSNVNTAATLRSGAPTDTVVYQVGTASGAVLIVETLIINTGSTSGTVQLQAAQNVATAGSTKIESNSFIEVRKLDV